MVTATKQKNVDELIKFTKHAVSEISKKSIDPFIASFEGVSIKHPTAFSKNKREMWNENDITVHINEGDALETIVLAEKISNNLLDINSVDNYLKFLYGFIKTKETKIITFRNDDALFQFTVPNFEESDNHSIVQNKEVFDCFIALIMIGVNDNGRYRQFNGENVGFNNHFSVAISAIALSAKFKSIIVTKIREMLFALEISDLPSFRNFLRQKKIIQFDKLNNIFSVN